MCSRAQITRHYARWPGGMAGWLDSDSSASTELQPSPPENRRATLRYFYDRWLRRRRLTEKQTPQLKWHFTTFRKVLKSVEQQQQQHEQQQFEQQGKATDVPWTLDWERLVPELSLLGLLSNRAFTAALAIASAELRRRRSCPRTSSRSLEELELSLFIIWFKGKGPEPEKADTRGASFWSTTFGSLAPPPPSLSPPPNCSKDFRTPERRISSSTVQEGEREELRKRWKRWRKERKEKIARD